MRPLSFRPFFFRSLGRDEKATTSFLTTTSSLRPHVAARGGGARAEGRWPRDRPRAMGTKRCLHGKQKAHCRVCNPCPHGKLKHNCVDCNLCPHGKHKRFCADCMQPVPAW